MTGGRRWFHRHKWLVAVASVALALALAEGLLRLALFHTSVELAAKDPAYYARTLDELWIYRHLFSSSERWIVRPGPGNASPDSRIAFYQHWAASLTPDAELGYVRKANVSIPCHETTSLATRGTRNYVAGGAKIVFLGDSFVESAACSDDTLTAKIERLTGVDTLNYGIGGYGVDQIFLYFKRLLPLLNQRECQACLFLVGIIQDDLNRVLLKIRTSPKPYFMIVDRKLVLHTEHIHADSLNDAYGRPPERLYLYYFLRGRLGFPVYRSLLSATRDGREQAILATSQLMFEEMAALRRQRGFDLAFVIFPTPGSAFDNRIIALLRQQAIPVIDLQSCLRESGRPDTELYAELHPTSIGNELLARCLLRELAAMRLLK